MRTDSDISEMPCEANSTQSCGDNNRQNIYIVTIATTAGLTTSLSSSKTTTPTPKPCPTGVSVTFRIPFTVTNIAARVDISLIGSVEALRVWDIPKSIRMANDLYTKAESDLDHNRHACSGNICGIQISPYSRWWKHRLEH